MSGSGQKMSLPCTKNRIWAERMGLHLQELHSFKPHEECKLGPMVLSELQWYQRIVEQCGIHKTSVQHPLCSSFRY